MKTLKLGNGGRIGTTRYRYRKMNGCEWIQLMNDLKIGR